MKFIDLLSMSLSNLFKRKLRSALTLLGIILGAVSVSITISMGSAIKSNNQKVLASKGSLTNIEVDIDNSSNKNKQDKEKIYMDDQMIKKLKNINGVTGVWAELEMGHNIMITAGKNHKYNLRNIMCVLIEDIEKFDYKLLNGKLPTQKTLSDNKKVQVLVGEYFEYGFNKTKSRNWQNSSRGMNSPVEKYYREKYDYGLDSFVLKPPFVKYEKDEMLLCISLPQKKASSNIETVDIMTGKSDVYFEATQKNQYKEYPIVVTGRLDWESNKDSSDYKMSNLSSAGVLIDISLGKEIINLYNRLNHISTDKSKPEFIYNDVSVKVKDVDMVEKVSQKIAKLGLRPKNRIEEVKKEQARTKSNRLVLGVLGAITLFVASLSVANTMITSMYERTKEIGVMKVIGCKVGNIKILFLLEAAILGFLGGTIGMSITQFISNFMNRIAAADNIDKLTGVARLLATYMDMMKYDRYSMVSLDISLVDKKLWIYTILGSVLVAMVAAYLPSAKASNISALDSIKDE